MTPKSKFTDGEKVLCFHGPLLYEAKALRSAVTKDKHIKYYIHYAGWNKNWDEWVPENRVLKYNEANVQRQKELVKLHHNQAAKKKGTAKAKKNESNTSTSKDGTVSSGGSESRASTPSKDLNNSSLSAPSTGRGNRSKQSVSKDIGETTNKKDDNKDEVVKDDNASKDETQRKKRGGSISVATNEKSASSTSAATTNTSTTLNSTSASASPSTSSGVRSDEQLDDDNFLVRVDVKIKIPDELKQLLVDDWDAVTRQQKLLEIPAKITVEDIFDQYVATKATTKTVNPSKEWFVNDIVSGLIEYFNVMLGSQLLYKSERAQYAEILQQHPETPTHKLYGAFHLLRLFVKLANMMSYSMLEEKAVQQIVTHVDDFLKFLVKNTSTYFLMSNFVNSSPEYHRNTQ